MDGRQRGMPFFSSQLLGQFRNRCRTGQDTMAAHVKWWALITESGAEYASGRMAIWEGGSLSGRLEVARLMKHLKQFSILWLAFVLVSCASLGIPETDTFNKRVLA